MKQQKTERTDQQQAMAVSRNSIIANAVLSSLKLFAGIYGNSSAMVSDAIHSASDVFSTLIVITGFRIAGKESDEKHPYGHERMECVASIILAVILLLTGVGIGFGGIQKLVAGSSGKSITPGAIAVLAAILSIAVKEAMYWYTRHTAKLINSGALMADAWHHRSDAFSSVGSLIGVVGARMGYAVLDPLASIIICIFIGKASVEIFVDAITKMTDESCDRMIIEEMKKVILSQEGVLGLDEIKTRIFGAKIYVDIEIQAERSQSLEEAHQIAQCVHDEIEKKFQTVKHCMVHVNPV